LFGAGLESEVDEKALREKGFWHNQQEEVVLPQDISPGGPWAGPQGIITWDFEATDGGFTAPPQWVNQGGWGWKQPTNGPGGGHSGTKCWGTNPDGPTYDPNADWLLYVPTQNFSALSGPKLIFWQWYETETGYDSGWVEVSTDGGATWTKVSQSWRGTSAGWECDTVNLAGYAGLASVGIRFRFKSDGSAQYDGWFIDDVQIINQTLTNIYYSSYETGDDGFVASGTTGPWAWQWGTPTAGPPAAHSGVNCWGTVLAGNYEPSANWLLTMPTQNFSGVSNPTLSFWEWYYTETSYDSGWVEVSTNGGGSWTKVGTASKGSSGNWVRKTIDLSAYGNQASVLIRFRFTSDGSVQYAGWYIDDVSITSVSGLTNVYAQSYEGTNGGLNTNGTPTAPWQRGVPTSGPGSAYAGSECWATNLSGNYNPNANEVVRLNSNLSLSGYGYAEWSFWRWYDTETSFDTCFAQVSSDGGSSWTTVAVYAGSAMSWTHDVIDVSAYISNQFRFRFGFKSDGSVQYAGFYFDSVRVSGGTLTTLASWNFEADSGNYTANPIPTVSNEWERGNPTAGPGSAHDGNRCWGTDLNNTYENYATWYLTYSGTWNLNGLTGPTLSFWEWYDLGSGDTNVVQISTNGGASWSDATGSKMGGVSGGWVYREYSLPAVNNVKVRFKITSDASTVSTGWYIDQVRVFYVSGTSTVASWNFEADSGNYTPDPAFGLVNINEWEWGVPPAAIGAHSGTRCWGTDLDNTYNNSATMILRAPVQNVSTWPRVIIDFWHWRDAETADTSIVEVSSDGGTTWNRVATYTGTFRSWRAETLNVSPYKSANFTFRFVLKTDASVSDTGWYVDDVELDTIPPSMVPITVDPIKVSQGYVACYIENTTTDGYGTITAATDTLHPRGTDISLLYAGASHDPWSSYLTVRSYRSNTDFVTRYSGCTTQTGYTVTQMDPYFVGSYMIKGNEDSVVTIWDGLPDNLRVEQHIYALGTTVSDARIQVMTHVINKSSQNRTVSVRYEWDIHIFDTDAPYLRAYKNTGWSGWYGSEKHWWTDSLGLYYEENQNPLIGVPLWHYISCTWAPWPPDPIDPDTFFFVRWPLAYGSAFPVNYMADGRDSLGRNLDDCVVFMWVQRTITPGDTLTVVEYLWSPNQPLYENVEEPGVPDKPFVGLRGPNPLRSGDALWFGLSRDQQIDLKLYSVDGRLVKTLVSGKQEAGTHAIVLPRLPSGTYFLIMDAETDGRFSRKLVVNR